MVSAVCGLIVGSFCNSVIARTAGPLAAYSPFRGRSRCPHCQVVLRARDLVPVVSFALLGGRCRACHQPISWQYPLVELALGVLFAWTGAQWFGSPFLLVFVWSALSILTILFVTDLRYGLLPDVITIPAIGFFIIFQFARGALDWSLVAALSVGGGFFLLQHLVSRGRWVGGGDIRLGALIGVLVGWPHILGVLIGSYCLGGIVAAWLLITHRARLGATLPLGTFLTLTAAVFLFWGDKIIHWYVALL